MSKPKLLIIDDDESIRWVLQKAMERQGIDCLVRVSGEEIYQVLKEYRPDAVISDIRMPGIDGLELLGDLQKTHPDLPVIIMTAHSDLETAVAAFKGGAFEYLPKPFDVEEATQLIQRALAQSKQEVASEDLEDPDTEMIGDSAVMQKLFVAIGRLSRSQTTVLINGETGTGKELVARAVHRHSPRASKPFIALNMAAIPSELVESELFGHEKGAFTGANQHRQGRFEQANQGTLFLDEIGDMPIAIQTRLLRVLEDGEFYRVGGHTPIKVDVRVIAATHQNLNESVQAGDFREDLFHRLNVIRLELPALRERPEDIPQLAKHFLNRAIDDLNMAPKSMTKELIAKLCAFNWPGNVRQLENSCRWLAVMASGKEIGADELPDELSRPSESTSQSWQEILRQEAKDYLQAGDTEIVLKLQPEFERILIEEALAASAGHKQQAAGFLGWGRNTLSRKLKQFQSNE